MHAHIHTPHTQKARLCKPINTVKIMNEKYKKICTYLIYQVPTYLLLYT